MSGPKYWKSGLTRGATLCLEIGWSEFNVLTPGSNRSPNKSELVDSIRNSESAGPGNVSAAKILVIPVAYPMKGDVDPTIGDPGEFQGTAFQPQAKIADSFMYSKQLGWGIGL